MLLKYFLGCGRSVVVRTWLLLIAEYIYQNIVVFWTPLDTGPMKALWKLSKDFGANYYGSVSALSTNTPMKAGVWHYNKIIGLDCMCCA